MRHAPSPPSQPNCPRPRRQALAAWAAAIAGLAYFVAHGGGHALWPSHIDWLQRNDWSQHYLGWAFWRRAPWSWPLGQLTELGRPVGTTVAYTDANPLLSFMLWPLARWLPDPCQFIGPFMGACFAAQGYVGARLAQALGATAWQAFCAGGLFLSAPVLMHRIDHDTLMAQWLILASLWLGAAPARNRPNRHVAGAWAILFVAISIHPYLTAMVLPLVTVAIAQHAGPRGALGPKRAGVAAVGAAALLGGAAWALGYLGRTEAAGAGGFGFFATDLTAWVNPMGWSRLLADWPAHRGQRWEGMGYLGAGVLALTGVAAAGLIRRRPPWARSPIAATWLLMALGAWVFALGNPISLQGRPWWPVPGLYAHVLPLCAMLRASGRFIWVSNYLIMAAAIAAVVRLWPGRVATCILTGALALQLADVQPQDVRRRLSTDPHVAMTSMPWPLLAGEYDHLVLLPPHFHGSDVQCNPHGYRDKIEMPPGFLAAASGMSINSSYVARADPRRVVAYCNALAEDVVAGHIDGRTVYLVDDGAQKLMAASGVAMACWQADGYTGCVRADRPTQATAWVARAQSATNAIQ